MSTSYWFLTVVDWFMDGMRMDGLGVGACFDLGEGFMGGVDCLGGVFGLIFDL